MSCDNWTLNSIQSIMMVSLFWICNPAIVGGQQNYYIEFTNINCQHNSSAIETLVCSLKKATDNKTLINGRLLLANDIPNFSIRTIVLFNRKNMPRMTLADITVNMCEVLNLMVKNKIVSLYMENFKKYLNVVPKCPLWKNFNYTLNEYAVDLRGLPSFFPEGSFKSVHQIIYENELSAQIKVLGQVIHIKEVKTNKTDE
ncbi:uncharacterized protein LOC106081757 [Stomoxys calcitrans]|uniref:uncharacterized protein LOC106081757 n=1 Tax=Stomoxys calcitrans TaxID=35570 RepID=UPI0027E2EC8E|nr:uncharacterized protein LOC106081757 [Stomoxys calcitrans]